MSAECHKCGTDIVYPLGTWPVGECPACASAAKIDAYRQALADIANASPGGRGGSFSQKLQRIAADALADDGEGGVTA